MPPNFEERTSSNSQSIPGSTNTAGRLDVNLYMTGDQGITSPGYAAYGDFPIPYTGLPRVVGGEGAMGGAPYMSLGEAFDAGHRTPVTSQAAVHRPSLSSAMGVGNSMSGSEQASPSSHRASVAMDAALGDGYRSASGMIDEDGPESKDKGEIPPWTELKTKAGKERKRLPLACIACRRKKIRCSGEKPACRHCMRSRIPCVYRVTARKAAPRTDYMAMLDKRLKRMEERIIKIVPKEEQDNTAALVVRAVLKPSPPGTAPIKSNKKRPAEQAFAAELDEWSRQNPTNETDSRPRSLMVQDAEESKLLSEGAEALPSKEIQEHLAEVFFDNVYGQTYHVLHKPSFMRKLRAGTVPPVLMLAVCAISARFSTHPKVSTTPAFLRGEEWASEARRIVIRRYEWPNITILTCLLILGLHEFGTCQGGRSWALGGQAIRMAFALQLHRDLDHDPLKRNGTAELSSIDREIRRRTMWACFLMDRFNSSGTDRPTFIKEESIRIQLPIKEQLFQLDMHGPTETMRGDVPRPVPPDEGQLADAKENMGVAAHVIRSIALWGRIICYLNQGGHELDPHPLWLPESQYTALLKMTEEFMGTLPSFLQYTPENIHAHEIDKLANQFLFLHISIQQNILFMNRFAISVQSGSRQAQDAPKEFITKAGARAFEAANRISELLRDAESYFVTAPFTGYCAFLSSTVHVFGVFSKNPTVEATSKMNLATSVKYLSKMKRYWGMFHWMSENLKEQYKVCADSARQGSASQPTSGIFQYGDWFDRYPHGVSHTDFEDPAALAKKEKGDDAVLGQASDYHTVEEFFHTLSPKETPESNKTKRRVKRATRQTSTTTDRPDRPEQPALPPLQPFTQMPVVPLYPADPYYNPSLLISTPSHSMLPQLDRQLVFGAYAGLDPTAVNTQNMLGWGDVQMDDMMSYPTEASSAWLMPFNMDPPEIGSDVDFFNTMNGPGLGYGMGTSGMEVPVEDAHQDAGTQGGVGNGHGHGHGHGNGHRDGGHGNRS